MCVQLKLSIGRQLCSSLNQEHWSGMQVWQQTGLVDCHRHGHSADHDCTLSQGYGPSQSPKTIPARNAAVACTASTRLEGQLQLHQPLSLVIHHIPSTPMVLSYIRASCCLPQGSASMTAGRTRGQ